MTTAAAIGYGVLFKVQNSDSPPVLTSVGEVTSITPPGISIDAIDATHSESPDAYREFIPGLVDGGEVELEINYVPGSAGMTLLMAQVRQVSVCEITFPDGTTFDFSAIMTEIAPEAPVDDKMTASVTFKVTGKPVLTAAP